jgi:hypothetical protein
MRFIQQAQRELGLKELSLRCDCENLETVYVVDRSGQLVVTDRGDTFQYLDLSSDQTYGAMDVQLARAICHRHGAELDDHDPELYPQVIRVVARGPLRDAVDAVAGAIDELFSTAMEKQRQPGGPPRD